jgi:hypothetical protein
VGDLGVELHPDQPARRVLVAIVHLGCCVAPSAAVGRIDARWVKVERASTRVEPVKRGLSAKLRTAGRRGPLQGTPVGLLRARCVGGEPAHLFDYVGYRVGVLSACAVHRFDTSDGVVAVEQVLRVPAGVGLGAGIAVPGGDLDCFLLGQPRRRLDTLLSERQCLAR